MKKLLMISVVLLTIGCSNNIAGTDHLVNTDTSEVVDTTNSSIVIDSVGTVTIQVVVMDGPEGG